MTNYRKSLRKINRAGRLQVKALIAVQKAQSLLDDAAFDEDLEIASYEHVKDARAALVRSVFPEHF